MLLLLADKVGSWWGGRVYSGVGIMQTEFIAWKSQLGLGGIIVYNSLIISAIWKDLRSVWYSRYLRQLEKWIGHKLALGFSLKQDIYASFEFRSRDVVFLLKLKPLGIRQIDVLLCVYYCSKKKQSCLGFCSTNSPSPHDQAHPCFNTTISQIILPIIQPQVKISVRISVRKV